MPLKTSNDRLTFKLNAPWEDEQAAKLWHGFRGYGLVDLLFEQVNRESVLVVQ